MEGAAPICRLRNRAGHRSTLLGTRFPSRALRRRISFGGGAPGGFDGRRRRADRLFSAAAALVKNRRRRLSAA